MGGQVRQLPLIEVGGRQSRDEGVQDVADSE